MASVQSPASKGEAAVDGVLGRNQHSRWGAGLGELWNGLPAGPGTALQATAPGGRWSTGDGLEEGSTLQTAAIWLVKVANAGPASDEAKPVAKHTPFNPG